MTDLLPIQNIDSYRRIVLVNPTKYLGNLLIAGSLIQDFCNFCQQQDKSLLIVLDESFREIVGDSFSGASLLFYPRQKINKSSTRRQIKNYLDCLIKLRDYEADVAFNIEEDSVSHRLTQFSGAKRKIGCSTSRHIWGYDYVIPVNFTERPAGRKHRWYSFYEVFKTLGMQEKEPQYMKLNPDVLSEGMQIRLAAKGVNFIKPIVAIHAGATKEYKKWPLGYFVELANKLIDRDFFPVFIGAGKEDKQAVDAILPALKRHDYSVSAVDLCDELSLAELASFFTRVTVMVGNDSGPFHLASALDIPGVVMFGPTDKDIWRPLSSKSAVLKGLEACDPECTRRQCKYDHRCLKSITPEDVMDKISFIINA